MNERQFKLTDDEKEFFSGLDVNEYDKKATDKAIENKDETDNRVNLDSLTVDELKRLIASHLEDRKREYKELLASYKTMKEAMDGWYYMGYIEDEYEILKPYAEKIGMLNEFEDVYNKFWPLEHMTYNDVQKLLNK